MRIMAVCICSLLLSGCSSEASRAEAELATIEKAGGNGRDKCAASKKVADAYLHENNVESYRTARTIADVECTHAEMDESYADGTEGVVADNMEAN